ncbi:MAG TPA: DUF362 domain-containing protein [Dehalococcoidia bacterium]|nr:DUF362 domain-containing protein [Dehalococcoidia bacterium]
MAVAIVKYEPGLDSMRRAIQLCQGFAKLKPTHKVFIKANMAWGLPGDTSPARGFVISPEIVEGLVLLLREYGCTDITVGEGSISCKELGVNTASAAAWAGVDRLAERMGFRFVDLNQGKYESFDFDGIEIEISKTALEAEYFINLCLLRAHLATRLSAALKNLKGTLSMESKKAFHRTGNLERFIALLATKIRCDLVLVDALWCQQQAPNSRRINEMGLLLAADDILECDIVGSHLLGLDPYEVEHLREYARIQGRSLELKDVEVRGEDIEAVKKPMPWYWDWPTDLTTRYQTRGLHIDHPGKGICSACYTTVLIGINSFLRDNRGSTFDDIQFCVGPEPRARPEPKRVILMGKCAIEANQGGREDAIKIKGCPPGGKRLRAAMDRYITKVSS